MNNIDLLKLYKQEKEDQNDIYNNFPTFKEWKASVLAENVGLYKTVAADEAIAESDILVDQADVELESRVATIVVPIPKIAPNLSVVAKVGSKGAQAMNIYSSMMVGSTHPKRKDVIVRYTQELDMSKACASTYHNTMKNRIAA